MPDGRPREGASRFFQQMERAHRSSRRNEHDEALALAREAVEAWPEMEQNSRALASVGKVLACASHRFDAVQLLEQALQHLDPNDAASHWQLAELADGIQDYGNTAVLVARWLVLTGRASWPEGGAAELLASHRRLWRGGWAEYAICAYLGELGTMRRTAPRSSH